MAYCPVCGRFWLVKTGQYVRRAIMGRSHNGVDLPPDMLCHACNKDIE